jgi:hypothetical protein
MYREREHTQADCLVLPAEQTRAELGGVDVGEPVLGDPAPRLGVPHPEDLLGRPRPVATTLRAGDPPRQCRRSALLHLRPGRREVAPPVATRGFKKQSVSMQTQKHRKPGDAQKNENQRSKRVPEREQCGGRSALHCTGLGELEEGRVAAAVWEGDGESCWGRGALLCFRARVYIDGGAGEGR